MGRRAGWRIVGMAGVSFLVIWCGLEKTDTVRGPRCNSGQGSGSNLDACLCLHAEENALLEAGRERIREGATLYCNTYAIRPVVVRCSFGTGVHVLPAA
jgi:hypothetical protein